MLIDNNNILKWQNFTENDKFIFSKCCKFILILILEKEKFFIAFILNKF